jgi:hypothetical protein
MLRGGTSKPGESSRGSATRTAAREMRIARLREAAWAAHRDGRNPTFIELGREAAICDDSAAVYSRILADRGDYPPFAKVDPRALREARSAAQRAAHQARPYVKPGPPPTIEEIAAQTAAIRADRAAAKRLSESRSFDAGQPIPSRRERYCTMRRGGWKPGMRKY